MIASVWQMFFLNYGIFSSTYIAIILALKQGRSRASRIKREEEAHNLSYLAAVEHFVILFIGAQTARSQWQCELASNYA